MYKEFLLPTRVNLVSGLLRFTTDTLETKRFINLSEAGLAQGRYR